MFWAMCPRARLLTLRCLRGPEVIDTVVGKGKSLLIKASDKCINVNVNILHVYQARFLFCSLYSKNTSEKLKEKKKEYTVMPP